MLELIIILIITLLIIISLSIYIGRHSDYEEHIERTADYKHEDITYEEFLDLYNEIGNWTYSLTANEIYADFENILTPFEICIKDVRRLMNKKNFKKYSKFFVLENYQLILNKKAKNE